MYKISIIVPIYKIKPEYLEACLDSVINQTLYEIQILLIDDGSKDVCVDICDKYASADQRILVIHQENQGVSCARNKGIESALADYILFLDADDLLSPDACEKLYLRMQITQAEILLFGHRCFNDSSEALHRLGKDLCFTPEQILTLQKVILNPCGELLTIAPAGTVGKIYRTDFIKNNHLRYIPGLKRMQDNLFCLYAYEAAAKVCYYDYIGYHYRINSDSACNKYNPGIFDILENALTEFQRFIETIAPTLQPYYYCKVITVLCNEYLHLYFRNTNNPKGRNELKKEFKKLAHSCKYSEAIKKVNILLLSRRLAFIACLVRFHLIDLLWWLLDVENFMRQFLRKKEKL